MTMADCFHVTLGRDIWRIFLRKRQIPTLRSQDIPKGILSDLVWKDVAEFNDKFCHFQYATLEIFTQPFFS